MTRPKVRTTVVCVVGDAAGEVVDDVGARPNCRGVRPDADGPLVRAMAAWSESSRANLPWLLHDADPLGAVAEAYRAFYDDAQHGAIEVAVHETLPRWRAGSLALPDYYLIVDAESLPATLRHFYLGLLHHQRPARVEPVPADAAAVRRQLPRLRAARWWPELDSLLDGLQRTTPDRAGVAPPVASW